MGSKVSLSCCSGSAPVCNLRARSICHWWTGSSRDHCDGMRTFVLTSPFFFWNFPPQVSQALLGVWNIIPFIHTAFCVFSLSLLHAGHLVFHSSDSAFPPPNLQSHGPRGCRGAEVGRVQEHAEDKVDDAHGFDLGRCLLFGAVRQCDFMDVYGRCKGQPAQNQPLLALCRLWN